MSEHPTPLTTEQHRILREAGSDNGNFWGSPTATEEWLYRLARRLINALERASSLAPVAPDLQAEPFDDWHEDDGDVLWWIFPVHEPPYVGSPLCDDWPFGVFDQPTLGWTRLVVPTAPLAARDRVAPPSGAQKDDKDVNS